VPLPVNSDLRAKALPRLRLGYERTSAPALLGEADVLAVIGFGRAVAGDDPRCITVGLDTLQEPFVEVWRSAGTVSHGVDGAVHWSSDGDYLFFAIEVDEHDAGGLDAAAERAYRDITALVDRRRLAGDARPEVLRLWNYLDAINEGDGDDERYRHFCSGRARGLGERARNGFSAATAIGRRDGRRVLQVYGLAARVGGLAIENPRQVSAWRYPREYGPTAPTFARATLTGAGQLLVSGTAAVVGHASQHAGDTVAQIDETLVNLDQLFQASGPLDIGPGAQTTLLKVYLRDATDASAVEQRIRARHPDIGGILMLAGDICRRELRVEVDGISG
jgi:chorismate lyase/3-hydroxybenzoate synthase